MASVTIPKKLRRKGDLLVVEKEDFDRLARENKELRLAMKAVAAGELSLRHGKTRTLTQFLKPQSLHEKNR